MSPTSATFPGRVMMLHIQTKEHQEPAQTCFTTKSKWGTQLLDNNYTREETLTKKNESSIKAVDGNVFSRFSHRKETEGNNLSTAIKNNIAKLRFQCANHSIFSRKKTQLI